MLTESLRAAVNEALAPYGASLGDGDVICSIKKPTGIRVDAKAGRFRFESAATGHLMGSGRANEGTVEWFVERFWYWRKL